MNTGQTGSRITGTISSQLPTISEEFGVSGVAGVRSVYKVGVHFKYIPQKPIEYTNPRAAVINFLDSNFNCIDATINEQLNRIPVWVNEHKDSRTTQKSAKEKYIKVIDPGFTFNTPCHGMPYVGIIHCCVRSDDKHLKIEDTIKSAIKLMKTKGAKKLVIPVSKELLQEDFRKTLRAIENIVAEQEYKPEEIVFINEVDGFFQSFEQWEKEKIEQINESTNVKAEMAIVDAEHPQFDRAFSLSVSARLESIVKQEIENRTIAPNKSAPVESQQAASTGKKKRKKNQDKQADSASRDILQAQFEILSVDLKSNDIQKIDATFSSIIKFLGKNNLKVSVRELNYLIDSFKKLLQARDDSRASNSIEINNYSFVELAKKILIDNFDFHLNNISENNSVDIINVLIKITEDKFSELNLKECNLDQLIPFMTKYSSLYSGQWIINIAQYDNISIKSKFGLIASIYENFKKDFISCECFKHSKVKLEKEADFFFKGFNHQNIRINAQIKALEKNIRESSELLAVEQEKQRQNDPTALSNSKIKKIRDRVASATSDYHLFSGYHEANAAMLWDVSKKKQEIIHTYDQRLNVWIAKKTDTLYMQDPLPTPTVESKRQDSVRMASIVERAKEKVIQKESDASEEISPEALYYQAFELFSKGYYKESQDIYKRICEQHRDSIFYIHAKLGLMESHTRTSAFRNDEQDIEAALKKAVSACADFRSAATQAKKVETSSADLQTLYATVTGYSDKLLDNYTEIMQEQLKTVEELCIIQAGSSSEIRPEQLSDDVLQFTIDATLKEHDKIYHLTELAQLSLTHVRQALQYRKEWLDNLRHESAAPAKAKKSRTHTMPKTTTELMSDLDDRIKQLDLFKARQRSTTDAINSLTRVLHSSAVNPDQ